MTGLQATRVYVTRCRLGQCVQNGSHSKRNWFCSIKYTGCYHRRFALYVRIFITVERWKKENSITRFSLLLVIWAYACIRCKCSLCHTNPTNLRSTMIFSVKNVHLNHINGFASSTVRVANLMRAKLTSRVEWRTRAKWGHKMDEGVQKVYAMAEASAFTSVYCVDCITTSSRR